MNNVNRSRERRTYDNTLREEQAQRTRERILEAAVRAIAEAGPAGVTLAQVARAAGVSEPTLYRHFGSRERLYEEIEAVANRQIGLPPIPAGLDEFPAHAGALYEKFGAHGELVQAMVRAGLGREIRTRGRARRLKLMRTMLEEGAPHLSERSLDTVTALLRVLVTWETFERMTGELGLTTEEAAAAAEWAVATLLGEVREGGGPMTGETDSERPGVTPVAGSEVG
jgi:AcrR family transcriptional regulator